MNNITKENLKDLWNLTSFRVVIFMAVLMLPVWMFLVPTENMIYQNILAGLLSGFVITAFHVVVDYKNLQLHSPT